MPGLLRRGALCPKCHTPLVAIVRTLHAFKEGLTVEYFHQKGYDGRMRIAPKARRKMRCKVLYSDPATAPDLDSHRSVA